MIEYRDISKSYQDAVILDHINLTVNDGEFVVIVGLSGCGKTTTLKMMNRLIEMDSGDIFIDGKNIKDFEDVYKRQIGTETRPKLLREAAVGNIAQWGKP